MRCGQSRDDKTSRMGAKVHAISRSSLSKVDYYLYDLGAVLLSDGIKFPSINKSHDQRLNGLPPDHSRTGPGAAPPRLRRRARLRRVATLIWATNAHAPSPWREKLAKLLAEGDVLPPALAQEARAGERSYAVLDSWCARGTAVDRRHPGISPSVAGRADRVVMLRATPIRRFARGCCAARLRSPGGVAQAGPWEAFYVAACGRRHGVLPPRRQTQARACAVQTVETYEVEMRQALEPFGSPTCAHQGDVEGSEREVTKARAPTIARERPVLRLDLLSGTHPDRGSSLWRKSARGFRVCRFRGATRPKIAGARERGRKNMSWGHRHRVAKCCSLPWN